MYSGLQSLISSYARDFMAGRIQSILPIYAPVLPVFIAGNRVTLGDHEQIADSLSSHLRDVKSAGFDALHGKLVALSLPRNGCFNAVVDWTYWHQVGFPGPIGRTTYYCHLENGLPKIDMMEYPLLAFESACDWYSKRLDPELLTGT